MTKPKNDPLKQVEPFIPRRHYACRLRLDLWAELKRCAAEFNCSQGVLLESIVIAIKDGSIVIHELSPEYDHFHRWLQAGGVVGKNTKGFINALPT